MQRLRRDRVRVEEPDARRGCLHQVFGARIPDRGRSSVLRAGRAVDAAADTAPADGNDDARWHLPSVWVVGAGCRCVMTEPLDSERGDFTVTVEYDVKSAAGPHDAVTL